MPFSSDSYLTITQQEKDIWRLEKDLAYYDSRYVPDVIIVPEGFKADGSSIPRAVWPLIGHPLYGALAPCGFLHDFLYNTKKYSSKNSDLVYREALLGLGVSWVKANICYLALRSFGWIAWSR